MRYEQSAGAWWQKFPSENLTLDTGWNYYESAPGPQMDLTIPQELGQDLYAVCTTYIPQTMDPDHILYSRGTGALHCNYDSILMESFDGVDTSPHLRFVGQSRFTLTLPGSIHSFTWDPGYKLYALENAQDNAINARALWEEDCFLAVRLMDGENIVGFLVIQPHQEVERIPITVEGHPRSYLNPLHVSLQLLEGQIFPMVNGKHQKFSQEYVDNPICQTIEQARMLQTE